MSRPPPAGVFPPHSSSMSLAQHRQPSINPHAHNYTSSSSSQSQSAVLQARIASKRAELAHLRDLRDLSGSLATQMAALETKLGTLRDGTEAVACVLANWDGVLRAIAMASSRVPVPPPQQEGSDTQADEPSLPVTLVRIPVQQSQTSTKNSGRNEEDKERNTA